MEGSHNQMKRNHNLFEPRSFSVSTNMSGARAMNTQSSITPPACVRDPRLSHRKQERQMPPTRRKNDRRHVCRRLGCQKTLEIIPVRTDDRSTWTAVGPRGQLQSTLLKTRRKANKRPFFRYRLPFMNATSMQLAHMVCPHTLKLNTRFGFLNLELMHRTHASSSMAAVVVSIHVHVQLGGRTPS